MQQLSDAPPHPRAANAGAQPVSEGSALQDGPASCMKVVQSADLLGSERAVAIQHNGATYRLQTTKLGKLILTK